MRTFSNGGQLVETLNELPDLRNATNVFLDFETTSGDRELDSLNPWFHCYPAGFSITVDDCPTAWYIPICHHGYGGNLPANNVWDWLNDVISTCKRWINHNIKYDVHVMANSCGILAECELVDTLTLSKLIDSDRLGNSLDQLAKDWLFEDITPYEKALKPYLYKNKDYGWIPADLMAPYACQDVLTTRRLYQYLQSQCPDQCKRVWDNEIGITSLLIDVERTGMRINPLELKIEQFVTLSKMLEIEAELAKLVGREFRPHVPEDCFEVLCGKYGLPVLGWTEGGNPSFDGDALEKYSQHINAPPLVVDKIIEFRTLHTFNNFFLKPYQTLHIDGVLHPSYNQCVRTGRMSCSKPNAQQLNMLAKKLIHPRPGYMLLDWDYSQIEFRVIVHYIQDSDAIKAYNENPDTDFHEWMATMCGTKRKPAKTMNFAAGYGCGEETFCRQVMGNKEIVGDMKLKAEEYRARGLECDVQQMCTLKAKELYDTYHATLPSLKRTSRTAARIAGARGYVHNLYGRHRKLPRERAHTAFNTVCQSTAADLMKDCAVKLRQHLKGTPCEIAALVHDDFVLEAPIEWVTQEALQGIREVLESPSIPLRVPVRCGLKMSSDTWAACE